MKKLAPIRDLTETKNKQQQNKTGFKEGATYKYAKLRERR
jgi:hypothetical protein